MLLEFEECIGVSDGELDVTARDSGGNIKAERVSRDFGNVRADLATDAGQPSQISSSRSKRISGFEEEGAAANALARAFNGKYHTSYHVKEKTEEDSGYEDRILVPAADNPTRIPVQIRHLDTEVIASIGKTGEFRGTREVAEISDSIDKAIQSKVQVDAGIKSSTILLLQIPAPLGKMLRREIQRNSFELRGFKAVWISPFQEECFEVFPALDELQAALAAYYSWQQEGPYWGNDQHHWYRGIDECRGIVVD